MAAARFLPQHSIFNKINIYLYTLRIAPETISNELGSKTNDILFLLKRLCETIHFVKNGFDIENRGFHPVFVSTPFFHKNAEPCHISGNIGYNVIDGIEDS